MRVMVWNVWWRFGGNWREREESIHATLEAYRPDVLGLTESWSGEGTDQRHRPARAGAPVERHGRHLVGGRRRPRGGDLRLGPPVRPTRRARPDRPPDRPRLRPPRPPRHTSAGPRRVPGRRPPLRRRLPL